MAELEDFSSTSFPYAEKTYADVDAACPRAEIKVAVTREFHRVLMPKLLCDLRVKGGFKGRYVAERVEFHGIALEFGDRLEPSPEVLDGGGGVDSLTVFPVLVTFWRASLETIALHRNPLWNPDTGATHDKIMGVDSLRTFALGVYLYVYF